MKKFIVLTLASLALWSCGEEKQEAPVAPPMAVDTVTAKVEDVYLNKTFSATIEGSDYVSVRPKVSGYVDRWLVKEGAKVTKGQTILKISEDNYLQTYNSAVAQVGVAKANLENAKLNLERNQSLYDNNIIGEFDLKSAINNLALVEAQLKLAEASAENAKVNLDYTNVKSPVTGYIGMINASPGDLVSSSDVKPITTASKSGLSYAYFAMNESEMMDITNANEGSDLSSIFHNPKLRLTNGTIYEKEGKLDVVSGVVDKSMGTVSIRASFENNGQLRGGSNGYVILPIEMKSIFVVSEKSTIAMQDKIGVYVVGDDNIVKMVFLEALPEPQDGNYIVTGGVKEGDKIITSDVIKLRPGMQVTPKN